MYSSEVKKRNLKTSIWQTISKIIQEIKLLTYKISNEAILTVYLENLHFMLFLFKINESTNLI